jgi:hypothetical protein
MPFNINTFKDNINTMGYLRTNTFEVFITTPASLQNMNINTLGTTVPTDAIANNMRYRTEQARIPGAQLMMADVQKYGVGPAQKFPFTNVLQETTFSILVDQYAENWQFWYQWLKCVFDFAGTEAGSSVSGNKLPTYTTEYKDTYATTMQYVIYDPYGNAVQRINLYEAYPTSIREIPLSWGGDSNLMRLAVSISFSESTMVGSSLESTSLYGQGKVSSTSDIRKFSP